MSGSKWFAKARAALVDGRLLDAKLLLVAGVTELAAQEGIRPIVTGGTSVDFWAAEAVEQDVPAARGYRASVDVDVVFLDADSVDAAIRLRRLLHEAGFLPADLGKSALGVDGERGWRHPDVPIPLELIGHTFHGDRAHVVQVKVGGAPIRMRGPEDTLWEHVEWAAHAHDQRSWTRALAIAAAQRDHLDVAYLRRLAKERGFEEALEQCLAGKPLD